MSALPGPAVVPQTGVARLVREVRSCAGDSIVAVGAIGAAHPLAQDGVAPAYLAIELGAQAAAAMAAVTAADAAPQAIAGRLVRVRDARFATASLPVDVPLEVSAERIGSAPPLGIYRIRVAAGPSELATATISTYSLGPGHE